MITDSKDIHAVVVCTQSYCKYHLKLNMQIASKLTCIPFSIVYALIARYLFLLLLHSELSVFYIVLTNLVVFYFSTGLDCDAHPIIRVDHLLLLSLILSTHVRRYYILSFVQDNRYNMMPEVLFFCVQSKLILNHYLKIKVTARC